MEIKTSEFFMNMKSLPEEGTKEFEDLINWEKEKCLGGVNINGILISGWLYWHLNHWWIFSDATDQYGNDIREEFRPSLRDNEWERAEAIEQCRIARLGYMEIGGRQGGKSELEASYTGYTSTLFKNSQSVLVGGNRSDIQLLTEKVDVGFKRMWKGIAIPKLDKDWRKPTVRLGYKDQNNEDHVWSYIMIRNAEEGNNTEAPAGTTAKSFIMDEVGKYPFSQTFASAKPALIGKFGMRCVPILVGTGGSFTKGADAERYFMHPAANNFLGFKDPLTGKETGKFLSGLYRLDCKENWNLADYLEKVRGVTLTDRSELELIKIEVSNKEKALEKILEERKEKAKDPDVTEYLKEIMYRPLTIEECFLTSSKNFYNGKLAQMQKEKIEENEIKGEYVELTDEGDKITFEIVKDRFPISSFPVKSEESTDAPIVIWEHPVIDPPYGLYVAGVDPYRFDQAETSDSLGAVYIFKRMHDIHSDKYQDCFVASYVARPKEKGIWNKRAELLVRYYNAQALCENDEQGWIEYMITKGYGHLLEDEPGWLADIIGSNSTILGKRKKGISRSSDKVRKELRSNFKEYMEEKVTVIKGDSGQIISSVLGINQVFDPMLCTEISKWNYDGNFDREIAASLAVTQAKKMDKMRIKVSEVDDSNIIHKKRERNISPFKSTQSSVGRLRRSPFKIRR